ncbi:MAG: DUF6785 family protein [Nitrososphaerota archaeon]
MDFLLEGKPFDSLRPLRIYPHWHGIGLGYFVPQDILFSIWFFYGVLKLFTLIGIGYRGFTLPDFPYPQLQSAGGYLFFGCFFLLRVFHGCWSKRKIFACGLLIIASGVVLTWMIFSGLSVTLATTYWLMVMLFTIVYVRIRAEIGMPYTWVYPYGMQREILFLALGVPSNLRHLALLGGFFWLSRHFFLPLNAAYAADAIKLIAKGNIISSKFSIWGFAGGAVGLWIAFFTHLQAYYRRGANFLEGTPGTGDFRTLVTVQDYRWLSQLVDNPHLLRRERLSWVVYGTAVSGALMVLRRFWTSSPWHPLGFILAGAYGHLCPYWFPCLVAWVVKGLILHYGGMRLYRKLIPYS